MLQSGKAGRNLGFHLEDMNKERAQETLLSEKTKPQSRVQNDVKLGSPPGALTLLRNFTRFLRM